MFSLDMDRHILTRPVAHMYQTTFEQLLTIIITITINAAEQPTCVGRGVLAGNHTKDGHVHRSRHSARGPHTTGALAAVTVPVPALYHLLLGSTTA